MRLLKKALADDALLLDILADDFASLIQQALDKAVAAGQLSGERRPEVEAALLERERNTPSAIGHGVMVPHVYLDFLQDPLIVIVRMARPINVIAPDGTPPRFIFLLLGPSKAAATHLDTLASIARLMSDGQFRYDALTAQNANDFVAAIDRFAARTSPPAPQQEMHIPEGLHYSGRLFGGVLADLRRRWPHYWSDFRDGLNAKCAASVLFMTLACLAPTVTFGGVMAVQTQGQIGAVEMMLATAICGMIYAISAGQPLILLGGTGPLLVFTAMLYRLCQDLSIPFLPTYAWVGLWTAALTIVLAATDVSFLMRYFTRFTDEIFSALISLIFIYEAVKALILVFGDANVSQASALLSLTLALGTFYVGVSLSQLRHSRYLRPRIREFLADFGPAIAITAMTLVDIGLHDIDLPKLAVPDAFGTTSGRPWPVSPWDAPRWVWLAAAGPALLATVLVFLDQNITARLVQSADQKLAKGAAYHWDLAIVGGFIGVGSLFGLPWVVAATVRSLNHVKSLATVESYTTESGEQRERVLHVRENRVTGFSIHLWIGLALWLLPLLKTIPMAVLYGLFLYMGVVSIRGNQFFERLSLWLMDPDRYPATYYLRNVPRRIVHQFTLLQLFGLVVLWVVKVSPLAILFPLFIALGIPIRALATYLFPAEYLAALDAETSIEEEADRAM